MAGLANSRLLRTPVNLLACGFGAGLAPKAPGTVGTVAALPVVLLYQNLPSAFQWLICAAMFAVGCWICDFAAKTSGLEDPQHVVWDEITGYCIAMAALPMTIVVVAAAFAIFRLLDIFKPFPISWAEKRFKGGLGIMLDDAIAGIATNVILIFLLPLIAV